MSTKTAQTDHPINQLLSERWSPYAFSTKSVSEADLRSLFEAARWAPSSYNEQPWSYVVARKENAAEFTKLLSCLVEGNQAWAKFVPVLAIGIVHTKFTRNGQPNKAAQHDLGLASANLSVEATARGLHVHQMIGIEAPKCREALQIPADFEALTALAIGYGGGGENLPPEVRDRDTKPRQRKPLQDFVFGATFGKASDFAGGAK